MVNNGFVGQRVIASRYLCDAACGDHPNILYAKPGDTLIITEARKPGHTGWAYIVMQQGDEKNCFGVSEGDVDPAPSRQEG